MKPDTSRPLVYLITTGESNDQTFEVDQARICSTVRLAVDLGVPLVQLREKNLSARNLFSLARELSSITRDTKTRLLVNDRADIAKAAGADGVHLTSRSLAASVVRKMFGPDFLIGVSTHNAEEVAAAREAADFVVFGPVFETPGKSYNDGVKRLREVCKGNDGYPILALGGIDAENFHQVLNAGAAGFAAIRSLNDPDSLVELNKRIGCNRFQ